jgi:uncharacterized membrane protein YfcA
MISVGTMASVQAIQKLRTRQVELRTGWVVAVAGLFGAPTGAWLGGKLPEEWLLVVFAGVVVLVAFRLLLLGNVRSDPLSGPGQTKVSLKLEHLISDSPSTVASAHLPALSATGLLTGFLAGLLGIGGGFVLVPALVLFCGLEMHLAIATSMFSIALISAAAMTSHWFAGQRPPIDIVGLFTLGGLLGMVPGSLLARRLSGGRLQQVLAFILLILAVFILVRVLGRF